MNEFFNPYHLNIPNADDILRTHCRQKAKLIYGNDLPVIVSKRLEQELSAICKYNNSSTFIIGKLLAEKSLSNGFPLSTAGVIGSSFIAFLCGITAVNPLPPHHFCPNCHYFKLENSKNQLLGYDLPSIPCPRCGRQLKTDGAGIMAEMLLGKDLNQDPDILLNLTEEMVPKEYCYIQTLFGESSVFRAGIKTPLPDGSFYRGIHRGGLFIVPKESDIRNVTQLRENYLDENNVMVTEEDYHSLKHILKMFILYGRPELSILHKLEEDTGILSNRIHINDQKILDVFLGKGLSFLPVQNRDWPDSVFNISIIEDNPCFTNLCRMIAIMHGSGTWDKNGEILVKQGKTLQEIIAFQDDILELLLAAELDRQTAFDIMNSVRTGKGLTDKMILVMLTAGIPEWYINSCKKITFLFPKAHIVERLLFYWKLAYYKCYHPEKYQKALAAFD